MRISFLARCFVAAAVLLGAWIVTSMLQGEDTGARGAVTICPLMKMVTHDGYCTYYALRCEDGKSAPCSYDDPSCTLTSTGCGTTGCINAIRREKNEVRESHAHKDLLDKGYKKQASEDKCKWSELDPPPTGATTGGTILFSKAYYLKYVRSNGTASLHAKVYLIVSQPTSGAPAVITVGHEISEPTPAEKTPDITISNSKLVQKNGHSHEVTVGDATYRIILHKDTTPDP